MGANMKTRFTLIICLLLTFLNACQSLLPTPTATPTSTPTYTPTPTATATATLTATSTPIPTATRELTLEEKYGYLVPAEEKVVLRKAGEYFIGDPLIPPGTKYTALQFRATGEGKKEQTPFGEVITVHLVYRDNNGVLQDIWMAYAGYSFGANKDGTNMILITEGNVTSARMGTPDELLKFVCPGDAIEVDMAWQKGDRKNIAELCNPSTSFCNNLMQESYLRITEDSEELKDLSEGNGVASSDFRLVPMYFRIVPGVLTKLPNGFGWEFVADGNIGCNKGWTAGDQIKNLDVKEGNLVFESTGNDAYVFSPDIPYFKYSEFSGRWGTGIEAEAFPTVEIRMKVSAGFTAQLFFTAVLPDYIEEYTFDEAKSLTFRITADGEFHTYTLDMTQVEKWNGDIEQLRLDPTDTRAMIEIDYIRFLKAP